MVEKIFMINIFDYTDFLGKGYLDFFWL